MKQLDPKAVWLLFISFVVRSIFPITFLSFWLFAFLGGFNQKGLFISWNWLWAVSALFLVICFVWAKLSYTYYRYELVESGFRKESGVIYKRYVTIPYNRIQNVDIYRGIWARILGLSDLQIQTAGASATVGRYGVMGAGAEGNLLGLSKEDAEKLRDELIARAGRQQGQGM